MNHAPCTTPVTAPTALESVSIFCGVMHFLRKGRPPGVHHPLQVHDSGEHFTSGQSSAGEVL